MLVSTALRAGDIMYLIFILEICMVTFMVKGHMPSVHKLVQYFQSLYRNKDIYMSLKVYILPTLKLIFFQTVLDIVVYQMLILNSVPVNSAVL